MNNFVWMLMVVGLIAISQFIGLNIYGFIFAVGALVVFVLIHIFTNSDGKIKKRI